MSAEPQLFRINPENRESEKIAEVEFASLGFQERRDIQEWVAANPEILGEDLLIIGKEFSGFDKVSDRLDLLAVDADGKLVVIELKRDDSGADAHWQAIKYASYLRRARADDIIRMLAEYSETSDTDATDSLLQPLNADDFNSLNNNQRIILASHRFAPEVTSAALWLNEKARSEDLITYVQLTPYQALHRGCHAPYR
ncbi:MAG: endonuclease NucS [Chloroflexota bacterium]|nr:endonuclease NucS [Chloroflexota bacterium]MDE2898122.1 endonuclease NucS [Chloroflexota bacterium]